jgi:hypothetical protein
MVSAVCCTLMLLRVCTCVLVCVCACVCDAIGDFVPVYYFYVCGGGVATIMLIDSCLAAHVGLSPSSIKGGGEISSVITNFHRDSAHLLMSWGRYNRGVITFYVCMLARLRGTGMCVYVCGVCVRE